MNNSSEIGLTLSTVGMLIVAARRSIRQLIAAKVVPLDITPHHYWMLMILFKGAPMSLGEVARAMWMDNPTVSRMVQQMGLRGYLTVGPDPTHGRPDPHPPDPRRADPVREAAQDRGRVPGELPEGHDRRGSGDPAGSSCASTSGTST